MTLQAPLQHTLRLRTRRPRVILYGIIPPPTSTLLRRTPLSYFFP